MSHTLYVVKNFIKGDKTDLLVYIHNLMGCFSFKRLHHRMQLSEGGRAILERRPVVNPSTIDIHQLSRLPKDTFGYLFYEHMVSHGFEKGVKSPPKSPLENEHTAYAKQRWRETHDFRHVLTEMPAKMADETIIAAFQYGNHRNSWSFLVMVIGPLFSWSPISPFKQWRSMREAYIAGKKAVCLASVDYEASFSVPLKSLQEQWNVKSLQHLSTKK